MSLYNFDFDNVQLVPKKCVVTSRSECDTTIQVGKHRFKLPIVPANMRCVIDEELSLWLAKNGYFYVMHRFDVDSFEFTKTMQERGLIASISVGVKEQDYNLIRRFCLAGVYPDYITIDIAHAHTQTVADMIVFIKDNLPNTFVIAGNVCTPEAVLFLENSGADAIKIGIGPGCFVSGTKISTKDGKINIEDIKEGDEVYTHKNRLKKVVGTKNRTEEDRLVIINNNLKSTANHEYYVLHKKYKNVVNENNIDEYAEWVEAERLTKEHLLIQYK